MTTDLNNLIDQLPEVYQDIFLEGKIIRKGVRECEKRWKVIKPHINPHSVIFDIGSSVGYFTHKIAQEFPDSLVVSFESDPTMCAIQSRIYQQEGLYNVVVCNHRLSSDDLARWACHAEVVDYILALSVIHHYPKDNVFPAFISMQELAQNILVEVPAKEEKEACGGRAKDEIRLILDQEEGTWLGDFPSHLGEYEREIILYEGNKNRKYLDAFFGVAHPDRHRFSIKDGKIDGKNIIKGINVWNLLHFNIVYPASRWWKIQARKAYEGIDRKSDVKPWNLLISPTGLVAIDYTTEFPEGDQAEFKQKDLEEMDKLFTHMKPNEYTR